MIAKFDLPPPTPAGFETTSRTATIASPRVVQGREDTTVRIFRDGLLFASIRGAREQALNEVVALANAWPERCWHVG